MRSLRFDSDEGNDDEATSFAISCLASAPASQVSGKNPIIGSWTLCYGPAGTRCHVFQALYRVKEKARMIQVTLLRAAGEGGGLALRAQTPLGTALSKRVSLAVDDAAPIGVPYIACWPRGCAAETAPAPDLEAALRAGQTLAVPVVGADTDPTVRFEVALDGFSRAFDRLRKK